MMYNCPSIGRSVAVTELVMKRQGFARFHRSLWWSFVQLTVVAGRSIPRTALSRKEEGIGDPRRDLRKTLSQELRNAMDSTFQLTEQALGARLWAQQGGYKFGLDSLVLHFAISLRWDLLCCFVRPGPVLNRGSSSLVSLGAVSSGSRVRLVTVRSCSWSDSLQLGMCVFLASAWTPSCGLAPSCFEGGRAAGVGLVAVAIVVVVVQ